MAHDTNFLLHYPHNRADLALFIAWVLLAGYWRVVSYNLAIVQLIATVQLTISRFTRQNLTHKTCVA